MRIVRTIAGVREVLAARETGATVGFVPTMGALHEGHVTLCRRARAECAVVAISVFVNPAQFNDPADLEQYPRHEERDADLALAAGVDVFFAPDVAVIYPPDFATAVNVRGPSVGHEGDHRPGHFAGVATVCLKLFNIIGPDVAYFGQKDAQQIAVIQQLARDLDLALRISVVPTVRDPDGLAVSSRNARLSPEERARALAIPRALRAAVAAYAQGTNPAEAARSELRGLDVQYADVAMLSGHATLVIAVQVGGTRLIDNVPLDRPGDAGL